MATLTSATLSHVTGTDTDTHTDMHPATDTDTDTYTQRALLESASGDTAGLLYTLYINAILFAVLLLFFEANRYMKQIYLKRMKMKFEVILLP
jgi:hypothetical protein